MRSQLGLVVQLPVGAGTAATFPQRTASGSVHCLLSPCWGATSARPSLKQSRSYRNTVYPKQASESNKAPCWLGRACVLTQTGPFHFKTDH